MSAPLAAVETSSVTALERRLAAAEQDPSQAVSIISDVAAAMAQLSGAQANALGDAAAPLLRRMFASDERFPGMERLGLSIHTVAAGESPGAILRRYGMGNALMQVLNPDYDDRRLGPGKQLKVIDLSTARIAVLVQLAAYRMTILYRPQGSPVHLPVIHVPCGVGLPDRPTPTGATTVTTMVTNPQWTHPDTREVIPANDPRNVLGGYWIGLDEGDGTFASIGFHGYTGAPAEDWIAQPGSRGCIRLLQPDIRVLYGYAKRGVRVIIVP